MNNADYADYADYAIDNLIKILEEVQNISDELTKMGFDATSTERTYERDYIEYD